MDSIRPGNTGDNEGAAGRNEDLELDLLMSMKCWLWTGVLLAVLSIGVYRLHALTDVFRTTEFFGPVKCVKMPASRAPEDVSFIPNSRVALMSGDDLHDLWLLPGKGPAKTPNGLITAVRLPLDMGSFPTIYPVTLKDFPEAVAFHPHGLYIQGEELYVINHAFKKGGERIEVFRIEGADSQVKLTYKRSILLPGYLQGIASDLVLLSPTDFMITAFKEQLPARENSQAVAYLKAMMGLKQTSVYRCTDTTVKVTCSVVANGALLNGITRRKDELFIADSLGKSIGRYRATPDSLEWVASYSLDYTPIHLEYDPETDLIYISALSRVYDFLTYVDQVSTGKVTDSDVIASGCTEFDPKTGFIRPIVMQKRQSGISSCARKGMFIAMGSLFDPHVLICPLEDPKSS